VGYFNTISSTEDFGAAYISPESIRVIHADTNTSGKDLILVGYEGTQGGNNGSVAVFEFNLKITPTITSLPKAGSINVGQSLGNSTLAGGVASVSGNFAFTAPSTIPSVGQSNHLVRFTPSDTTTYSPVILSVPVFAINTSGNSTIINSGETAAFTANQTIKAPEGNGTLLLANSTVTLQSNGTTEFSGNIEGDGGLVKEGSGTLVLSGNNSFNGAIEITSGAIEISGSGLLAGGNYTGTIENEGIFKFAAASNQTLSGEIVGSGEIVKENASTLVLAGNSTAFTGNITANDGTLKISGSLPNSRVSIDSNAMLIGTGTIGDTVVAGIIAPGNSPGTLTTGNYTFDIGGNYTWEVSDATGAAGIGWDQIIANGDVHINSTSGSPFTINVTPFGEVQNWSDYQSGNWTILSYAGTLTGFDSSKFLIQSSLGTASNWSLASTANELRLLYTGLSLPPAGGNSGSASQSPSNSYSEQKSKKKKGASKKKSGEKKSKSDKKSSKDKSGGKKKLKKKR
jgi:autotransporter-associated beta strand protein